MNLMFFFFTICKIILKLYFGYRRENDEAEKNHLVSLQPQKKKHWGEEWRKKHRFQRKEKEEQIKGSF